MVAVDLGLTSDSRAKNNPSPSQTSAVWNQPHAYEEDDDSWEVRMFEEDTLECTWPPRSYTCTFCKREFRSAQALGGHMNVHCRERARLIPPTRYVSKRQPSSALVIPTQEFLPNGMCLLYSFPNPNPNPNGHVMIPSAMDPSAYHRSFISIPPFVTNGSSTAAGSSYYESSNNEEALLGFDHSDNDGTAKDSSIEELDLELHLGRK